MGAGHQLQSARLAEGLVARGAVTASEIPGAASTIIPAGRGGGRGGNAGGGPAGGAGRGGGRGESPLYAALTAPELRDPRGFVLPSDQPDFGTATKFVNTLMKTGITIHRATAPFTVGGKSYPANSYVVKTAQAFRPHVMDMFEPQDHPDDIPYPGGPPTPPYDATGYTLAFQMGVRFDRILEDFSGPFDKLMAFFFYAPNLLVVEALIRAPRASMSTTARWAATAAFSCATLFLVLGTYYFTKFYWGPAILARIGL